MDIKVKDSDNLVRDSISNGIVNTDKDGYNSYIENYKRTYQQSKKILDIESDLNSIKSDIDEIKQLLREMIK